MIKGEEVKEQFRNLKLRFQQSFNKLRPIAMESKESVAPIISQKLNGVWAIDKSRSTDQKELFDIMEMNKLFRLAAGLLNRISIEQADEYWILTAKASIINIREKYPLSGEVVLLNRRDKRSGKARSCVIGSVPPEEKVTITHEWDGYLPGKQAEYFYVTEDEDGKEILRRETDMVLKDGRAWKGTAIYTRIH